MKISKRTKIIKKIIKIIKLWLLFLRHSSNIDEYYLVRKVSFFRKRVFYNNTPSYKHETKSVKCRCVYLNRTKWIVRNSTK